ESSDRQAPRPMGPTEAMPVAEIDPGGRIRGRIIRYKRPNEPFPAVLHARWRRDVSARNTSRPERRRERARGRVPLVTATHDEVVRGLAAGEPRTSLALGAVLGARRRHDARLLTVGPADRTVCPLVRVELGVWLAYPVLGATSDAAALAAAIDR